MLPKNIKKVAVAIVAELERAHGLYHEAFVRYIQIDSGTFVVSPPI